MRTHRWPLPLTLLLLIGVGESSSLWAEWWNRPNRPSVSVSQPLGRLPVPLEQLPAAQRDAVRRILTHPTLSAQAPSEEFKADPAAYVWLLDHPERVAQAWRRLGYDCVTIRSLGQGRYSSADGHGSSVVWDTLYAGPNGRVWLAEGQVKPGPMLPTIAVRAVAILRHERTPPESGPPRIRQQVEVFFLTDSRAAALVARLLGPTTPRLAEQGAEQLQLFYSSLARILHRNPDRADELLAP